MKNKVFGLLSKMEILIPVVLFLTMLISCGLYLNVKMNGTKPGLPSLPEKEKRLIMRSESGDNTDFNDDLIEPVFVGVKNDSVMVAAVPDDSARRSIEAVIYTPLFQLFSGESRKMVFSSENDRVSFIEDIKNSKEYMLISFYTDIPSSAFLPCIVSGFDFENHEDVYNIRNMFLLPDSDGNLYAVALSSDKEIYTLYSNESIPFSKINVETYDISDGWSYFDFPFHGDVTAEISNSVVLNKYQVNPVSVLYGKNKDADWVNDCFDLFSVNSNLVKSFSSGDGFAVNYVDEISELIFDDNGFVEYNALDNVGINLDEYLGYVPDEGSNYTFSDKIFAIKKIINRIDMHNDNVSYSFSGFGQEENSNKLKVYFKLVCDGILLTDSPYDAVFEIDGNNLVYAKYLSVICSKINEHYTVLPQKYANVLLRTDKNTHNVYDVYCPVMTDEDSENRIKVVKWARIAPSSSEVIK